MNRLAFILLSFIISLPISAAASNQDWEDAKGSAAEALESAKDATGSAWKAAKDATNNAWGETKNDREALQKDAQESSQNFWEKLKKKAKDLQLDRESPLNKEKAGGYENTDQA